MSTKPDKDESKEDTRVLFGLVFMLVGVICMFSFSFKLTMGLFFVWFGFQIAKDEATKPKNSTKHDTHT